MTAPLFTREKLEELARACGNGSAEWIRVQLDTGGIAAGAASIAKILFFIFLIGFAISLVLGLLQRPR